MLNLDCLIAEATALTDADKAILIDKILKSMTDPDELEAFERRIQAARDRLNQNETGVRLYP